MSLEKELFYEKQTSWMLIIMSFIPMVVLTIIYFSKDQPSLEALYVLVPIFIIIIACILLFSTLTIRVTPRKIEAYFSFKIFRQSMAIQNINWEEIEVCSPNALWGVGLRKTPKGTLYNTQFGKAIYLKSINGKTFFVGSDKAKEIKEIIQQLKTT